MTEQDPLLKLRALPLPAVSPGLTARIKERAHAELGTGVRPARSGDRRLARVLSIAAVVALSVVHLGWTMAFLTKMHAPPARAMAARAIR